MPTGKGFGAAVRAGHAIGCEAVQLFTSSPQQWRAKTIEPAMVEDLRAACQETGIRHLVSHDSYLINLASEDPELRAKSEAGLIGELQRSATLGIPLVVSHMGSCKDEGAGLARIAESALRILAETPDAVTLCMETTAGQGSSLNYRFEHLASILEQSGAPARLGVCLDTCHVFAAGYDIRSEEGYELTFAGFDTLIGLDRLKVFHLNDSKKPLGSRVDRHEHIGQGELGPEPFARLVNDPRFTHVPMVLETHEPETMHARNLAFLRGLERK